MIGLLLAWKAWMRERSMMEGLLVWTPATDSRRPSFWKELLTEREARESLIAKRVGQVSLTQLKPMDFISFEIESTGLLLTPSATTTSKCETQFTHASFTLRPSRPTIHRESVWRKPVTASSVISTSFTVAPWRNTVVIIIIGAKKTVKTTTHHPHLLPVSISYETLYTTKTLTYVVIMTCQCSLIYYLFNRQSLWFSELFFFFFLFNKPRGFLNNTALNDPTFF